METDPTKKAKKCVVPTTLIEKVGKMSTDVRIELRTLKSRKLSRSIAGGQTARAVFSS